MQLIDTLLGDGQVGVVKKVTIKDNVFAIKLYKNGSGLKEFKIHKMLKHQNIVNLVTGNEKYIVTELMSRFNLFDFVGIAGSLSVNTSNYILKQLIYAIKYMHELRIAHRDIKLENVLVDEQTYQIKLCDFDASESLDQGKVQNQIGTWVYLAPEINLYGQIDAQKLKECDIHSLGVLYYILLFGRFPFKTSNESCPLYKLILQNRWDKYWQLSQRNKINKIPSYCLELIQGMIDNDPMKRLNLDEILNRIVEINEGEYFNEMQNLHQKLQQQT